MINQAADAALSTGRPSAGLRHALSRFIPLACAWPLIGCATGPAFVAPPTLGAGEAAVVIYRPFVVKGSGVVREVRVDGWHAGRLPVMAHLQVRVPAPGTGAGANVGESVSARRAISLQVQACEPLSVGLQLRAGEVAYVEASTEARLQTFGGKYYADHVCLLKRRTEAEALPLLTGLRAAE